MAESKPASKDRQKSAKRTTAGDKKYEGFTDEERGAMKERAQELKAAARRGPLLFRTSFRGHLALASAGLHGGSLLVRPHVRAALACLLAGHRECPPVVLA